MDREPTLLPRPRSYQGAPDGRRVPDREPVEHLDATLPAQGYHLEVTEDVVRVSGADEAGLRHGRATLAQLRHPAHTPQSTGDRSLPACRIDDWPDFAVRGVMLDVSRDRVPTLQSLRALVDRLASWKINQLQLYMEHTFAYAGHEDVWRNADPYTADDMRALDDHCRSRGVELVANQNTLGHFERWLRLDRYRPLAIAPDGFDWVMGIRRPPLTLDPANPEAFALVSDLLAQLVPQLESTRVHVGMDEPWELSSERRGEWAQLAGRAEGTAGPRRPGAARVGRRAGRARRPAGPAPRRGHGVRVGVRGQPSLRRTCRAPRAGRGAVLGVPGHVELDVACGTGGQHDRERRERRPRPASPTARAGSWSPTGATWATTSSRT